MKKCPKIGDVIRDPFGPHEKGCANHLVLEVKPIGESGLVDIWTVNLRTYKKYWRCVNLNFVQEFIFIAEWK